MSELIIIGNGFDLAHGLETSYQHFLMWLLKEYTTEQNKNDFANGLMKSVHRGFVQRIDSFATPSDFLDIWNSLKRSHDYKMSPLLKRILSNSYDNQGNWVDIECMFYEELLHVRNINHKIDETNKDLKTFSKLLEVYLGQVVGSSVKIDAMSTFFDDNDLCILDFNYTGTVLNYLSTNDKRVLYIPIHGHIEKVSKGLPIVFGYGDDYHHEYETIKNSNNDRFFTNLKSFAYLRNRNYHDLLGWINSRTFDVRIIGHSCGISDRTLLREIFQHQSCTRIYPYYYPGKDSDEEVLIHDQTFLRMCFGIARQFERAVEFRFKVQSFSTDLRCPQITDYSRGL